MSVFFGLLDRQGDAFPVEVDPDDFHRDDLPHMQLVARMGNEMVGDLRDMDEAILVDSDIDESTKI